MKIYLFTLFSILLFSCNEEQKMIGILKAPSSGKFEYDVKITKLTCSKDSIYTNDLRSFKYFVNFYPEHVVWNQQLLLPTLAEGGKELLLYNDGLSIDYSVYEYGELNSILNWPKIEVYMESVVVPYFTQNNRNYTEEQRQKSNDFIQNFLKHDNLEAFFGKEMAIYHRVYGLNLPLDSLQKERLTYLAMENGFQETVLEKNELIDQSESEVNLLVTSYRIDTPMHSKLNDLFEGLIPQEFSILDSNSMTDSIFIDFDLELKIPSRVKHLRNGKVDSLYFEQVIELDLLGEV